MAGMTLAGGVVPALPTPFAADGTVSPADLRRAVRFAAAAGAHGVLCCGLAGEVDELSHPERIAVVATAADESAGALSIVAGAGSDATPALVGELVRVGADAIMLPSPSAAGGDAVDELARLAGAAGEAAVVLQDAPAYLGRSLGPERALRVAELAPNAAHLKLEGGSRALAAAAPVIGDELALWSGDGGVHLLDAAHAGAVGAMPGLEVAERLVAAFDALALGDEARAQELHAQTLPFLVFAMQSLEHYIACAKAALVRRGVLERAGVRRAGAILDQGSRELLDRHLARLGIVGPLGAG
jgi:4-hydroxy-tetrahydrodipicolinate synthase